MSTLIFSALDEDNADSGRYSTIAGFLSSELDLVRIMTSEFALRLSSSLTWFSRLWNWNISYTLFSPSFLYVYFPTDDRLSSGTSESTSGR